MSKSSDDAAAGAHDIVVAGGMESMTNAPYYLPQARSGYRSGHGTLIDGMIHDGLWDPHVDQHMGACAEACAKKYGITRQQQDDHALESFRRATEAAMSGAADMVHTYRLLWYCLTYCTHLLCITRGTLRLPLWYTRTDCCDVTRYTIHICFASQGTGELE